jgi:sortase A
MSTRHSRLAILQWLFAVLGVLCLSWYSAITSQAIQYQRAESARLNRALERQTESPTIERGRLATPPSRNKPDHQLVGRLEIPRLKLSVMVVDGDDPATLKTAAGHLPDTPLPWEFGNSAVAAHRDSFFRPLADIKLSDRLIVTTPHGTFAYVVSKVRIVEPDDVSVLAQTGRSSLTLVTCYPFTYVGRAPKRFVVRADHVPSGTGDDAPVSSKQ